MTVLQALAALEAATVECKQRNINTPEVKEALDLLERYIRPEWLIPQFRNHIGGERENDYQREGQQQVLRATFPGIRDSVRELLGVRADALARKFHETHATKGGVLEAAAKKILLSLGYKKMIRDRGSPGSLSDMVHPSFFRRNTDGRGLGWFTPGLTAEFSLLFARFGQ
jgi:hypothetical protein